MNRLVVAALALFACTLCWADEAILRYEIDIEIEESGALLIAEHITVRAEGRQIRRGIFRDFPTRYKDRFGNRVVVDLEVLGVERNGQTEPWFTENVSNGVRINTGNDNFLPVPADYTFTIRYRTTRQLGFFDEHDELYFNAIGGGWAFPIHAASVEARLPEPISPERMGVEAYTGYQGAKGTDYVAQVTGPGRARWLATRPLQPGENFTIVLTFPKGMIPQPTAAQRIAWLLKDNRGVLIAILALITLIVYCVRTWHRVGRDPRRGIIIARYEPPEGHSPASLRYVRDMGYDMRCFTADVLALAVRGLVRVVREDRLLKDRWKLERVTGANGSDLPGSQAVLLNALFKGTTTSIELTKSNATRLQAAKQAHSKALDSATHPRYFERNARATGKAFLIGFIGMAAAFMFAGGTGTLFIGLVAGLMVIVLVAFGFLVQAPTEEGRKLMDEIEGLKLYLSVAERDELARMKGPDAPPAIDAERYERLLPFAIALEVEDAWTDKFRAAVGAAMAAEVTRQMSWYRGSASSLNNFSRSLGSALTSQIASSSTPPGSASGSGGGGSAGGGGGGGGGGGR